MIDLSLLNENQREAVLWIRDLYLYWLDQDQVKHGY